MASTSAADSITTAAPRVNMPELSMTALAKTTRKTVERMAPFSLMTTSDPTKPLPLLAKIVGKVNAYIRLIDASMLSAQIAWKVAGDAMVLCDPELRSVYGRESEKEGPGTGEDGEWDPASVTWESLADLAQKGAEQAAKVEDGFVGVRQEVYKIAASTKDNMLVVLVPPDPSHSETLRIHLKEIGTNLVANLSLLAQFSKAVSEMADWWDWVKSDLAAASTAGASSSNLPSQKERFERWSMAKEGWQEYYNVINSVHDRFPALLAESSAAWQSVAIVGGSGSVSRGPSSEAHSGWKMAKKDKDHERRSLASRIVHTFRFKTPRADKVKEDRKKETSQWSEKEETRKVKHEDKDKLKPTDSRKHDIPRHRLHTSGSSNSSSFSRVSNPSQSKRSTGFFSCCSGKLFEDGVWSLGCHGLMMR
ncbi:hypothetical protein B0H34DRAFT_103418 [Crassisporium funariophilum]|nr:hypothetical protein B0H34DRAFT_103418 [Crassisporium funariophilum]